MISNTVEKLSLHEVNYSKKYQLSGIIF